MQNILVPLTGCENDARALEAAYLVASRSGDNISALHVSPNPMQIVTHAAVQQFVSRIGNVELIHSLEKLAVTRRKDANDTYCRFTRRHSAPEGRINDNVRVDMEEFEGDTIRDTTLRALYFDLIVLARASGDDAFSTDAIANILVGCGRPVLVAPQEPLRGLGETVAIAWKEKPEAARAVTAAMPLLRAANRVVVLSVPETKTAIDQANKSAEFLASQLDRQGIPAFARYVPYEADTDAAPLLQAVRDAHADILVMGAYGHSRARELVFGGFTRHVLKECALPVLMLH